MGSLVRKSKELLNDKTVVCKASMHRVRVTVLGGLEVDNLDLERELSKVLQFREMEATTTHLQAMTWTYLICFSRAKCSCLVLLAQLNKLLALEREVMCHHHHLIVVGLLSTNENYLKTTQIYSRNKHEQCCFYKII